MQGLVIENISNIYKVETENNDIYETNARGKLKKDEIIPVVGDNVEFEIIDKANKIGIINEIVNRKVYIKRPKLANLNQIILVISSKDPKPDLLMLDKQLVFAEFLNIQPLIVLNKTDLDTKEDFKEIKRIYQQIGYKVIETQAKNKKGIKELKEMLKGKINAFAGNSGVGKSTLINAIFNKDMTQEGEISKKNKKGKNTTTSIKLYKMNENTYIADTPGFSTFSIEEIESKELYKYFREFKKMANKCEFVSCTHIKEENCGIKISVKNKEIEIARYNRFCKIYEELKLKEERKKW